MQEHRGPFLRQGVRARSSIQLSRQVAVQPTLGPLTAFVYNAFAMAKTASQYDPMLRDLAALMVAIAGESVTMIKRALQEKALAIKGKKEWDIYLEFMKAMFNLADRISAHHIPLRDQPMFMDSLEDAVSTRLQSVLAPALGAHGEDMEITLTIGGTVAESRRQYERFKFVVTEDSKQKDEYCTFLGEQVAKVAGAQDNGQVISSAILCMTAVIPAMKSAMESLSATPSTGKTNASPVAPAAEQSAGQPVEAGAIPFAPPQSENPPTVVTGDEIKLISIMATVSGEEVETFWGLHPRFRQDLQPGERQEITRLMNRITQILGERYATVAFSPQWTTSQRVGNA